MCLITKTFKYVGMFYHNNTTHFYGGNKKMMKAHVEKRKGTLQSNLDFKMMAAFFKVQDVFKDPIKKLEDLPIHEGDTILDYGCGPGRYSIKLAEIVGPSGRIYSADIHPLAIKSVKSKAKKYDLNNIEAIQTDSKTNLDDENVDMIIFFDILHALGNKEQAVLNEFFRLLKSNSYLVVDDHHYDKETIISKVTANGNFFFYEKLNDIYLFKKGSEK